MQADTLTLKTRSATWVIPNDCELLKALLKSRGIDAHDLEFSSTMECRDLIQRLALLATKEELSGANDASLKALVQNLMTQQFGQCSYAEMR